jgi:hypothetical protein
MKEVFQQQHCVDLPVTEDSKLRARTLALIFAVMGANKLDFFWSSLKIGMLPVQK